MSKLSKPEKSQLPVRSDERPVAPAVKGWLENVLVPAMVEQYLAANVVGDKITESNQKSTRKTPGSKCGKQNGKSKREASGLNFPFAD